MRRDRRRAEREMRDKERGSGTLVKSKSDEGERKKERKRERKRECVRHFISLRKEERRVRTPVQDL